MPVDRSVVLKILKFPAVSSISFFGISVSKGRVAAKPVVGIESSSLIAVKFVSSGHGGSNQRKRKNNAESRYDQVLKLHHFPHIGVRLAELGSA